MITITKIKTKTGYEGSAQIVICTKITFQAHRNKNDNVQTGDNNENITKCTLPEFQQTH